MARETRITQVKQGKGALYDNGHWLADVRYSLQFKAEFETYLTVDGRQSIEEFPAEARGEIWVIRGDFIVYALQGKILTLELEDKRKVGCFFTNSFDINPCSIVLTNASLK